MKELIRTVNIYKNYSNGAVVTSALAKVNIVINRGEFLSIMGPSGSGKTTLLNVLSTIDRPTKGKVYFKNKELNKMNSTQLANFRGNNIGFIFQEFNLLDNMSVQDNIALPLIINNIVPEKINYEIDNLAKYFKIEKELNKYPYELSGGQKQRAAIARAMISNPSVIFADEPTGALDTRSSDDLLKFLVDLNKQREYTIVMVTHNPKAASYSDKVLFLEDGQVYSQEIKGNKSNNTFYEKILENLAIGGV